MRPNPRPTPKPLRSQPTRDRILREAQRLFAEIGYERTTIRAVASAADINVSMVIRYFGSKDDLFAAAARIDLRIPSFAGVPKTRRGATLVAHFVERWEGPDAGDQLPAMLRAAATHDGARRRLFQTIGRQVAPALETIVGSDRLEERLGLIATQIAGLAFMRYVVRHPLVTALDRDTIVREVGRTVQRYLTG